jgi:hypothetical protein
VAVTEDRTGGTLQPAFALWSAAALLCMAAVVPATVTAALGDAVPTCSPT